MSAVGQLPTEGPRPSAWRPLPQAVSRWIHGADDGAYMPYHIAAAWDRADREHDIANPVIRTPLDVFRREAIREELDASLPERTARREAEQELAWYIRQSVIPAAPEARRDELLALHEKLMACRQSGHGGAKPEGGVVIAWDSKCSEVRLCPDEAREETRRLAEHYQPALEEWVKARPGRRLIYAVLTSHNFAPGDLRRGKRYLFERFQAWKDQDYDASPVHFLRKHGRWQSSRPTRKRKLKARPEIKGALVVQEDPLSAGQDWNVHLNVILLVEGHADWKQWRQDWGFNAHFQVLNPNRLTASINELVKYSAKQVPLNPDGSPENQAPAMTEWSPDRWMEWWDANTGFRRVRAYGAVYAVDGKRWDAHDPTATEDTERAQARERQRLRWLELAEIPNPWQHLLTSWGDLPRDTRDRVRRAIQRGEDRLDMSLIDWIGRISYSGAGYEIDVPGSLSKRVDFIQGDNFSDSGSGETYNYGEVGPSGAGPPLH